MNTKNPDYPRMISEALLKRGESSDYVVGYLEGILNLLTDVYENKEVVDVLKRQLTYVKTL